MDENQILEQLIKDFKEKKSKILNLDRLELKEFPLELFELKDSLHELDLSNNFIIKLPQNIGDFIHLEDLSLRNNKISALPNSITKLNKLRYLDLGHNELKTLPRDFGNLTALKKLDIRSNKLNQLPASIGNLNNLNELLMGGNRFSFFPESMRSLRNLQHFEFEPNHIHPPENILSHKIFEVINYFIELGINNQTDFLFEIKLILLGEPRAGKSTIGEALSRPTFLYDRNRERESTHGINIFKWIIPNDVLNLPKDFRVNVWDFGGQDIYHSTHHLFLTTSSLYLLVGESRKDVRHQDYFYWLTSIESLGDKSPVIIITSKSDLPNVGFPTKDYKEKFKNIVHFIDISFEAGYACTLINLKNVIYDTLLNNELLPEIGIELPAVWIDIRNELERLKDFGKRDYISYEEYLEICSRYKMNEERALFLSQFYHRIGVIIHYQDDISLRNTIFLNHQWLADAVYKILDDNEIKSKNGKFTKLDLMRIWSGSNYTYKQAELISAMKNNKFELCYDVGNDTYYAPSLFSQNRIDYNWDFRANLQFQYNYKFMPKGILSRFIVKRSREIHENIYWRYGVILEYRNTKALIIENYNHRNLPESISIKIQGENKKSFLNIICKTFEEINSSLHLEVSESIPCNCTKCKNSQSPFMYQLENLLYFKKALRKNTKECGVSGIAVVIDNLIEDITHIPDERLISLINRLKSTKTGTYDNYSYQEIVYQIFNALFETVLVNGRKEQKINDGSKRIDIVYDNHDKQGFFYRLNFLHKIYCPYIFVECKNYSVDLGNPEIDQLTGRFKKNLSQFGFIVCRNIHNSKNLLEKIRNIENGTVVILTDSDLINMLNFKMNEDENGLSNYLTEKLTEILMS